MSNIRVENKATKMKPALNNLHTESENITAKYFSTIKNMVQRKTRVEHILIGALLLLALLLRISFLPFESGDYQRYVAIWYSFMRAHGGFLALKYEIGDYTPFYFYFIAFVTYIPIPQIVSLKGISIFFDFVLAFFAYLIVKTKYPGGYVPFIASVLILFAPTIFINSALWSQSDGIYTAFGAAGLYFLMKKRPWLACFCFGLSLSFKPEAIFLSPLLLCLWMKREVSIKHLVMIPVTYLLIIFPPFLLGRSFINLLTIYVRATGEYPSLTLHAPTFWQWFPDSQFSNLHYSGIILAMACVIILCFVVYVRHQEVSAQLVLLLAFIFVLSIPFFLPEMHERYFYMADVISIIYACYVPRQFYLAIVVQLASLLSYVPVLFYTTIISFYLLSFLILGAIIITVGTLIKDLYFVGGQLNTTQVENEALCPEE
ncbi:hypothetical protein [Dictyobacter halimunensis]